MISQTELDAINAATAVRQNAWAPYSNFLVGCALVDANGGIHVGCNVENVSYGLTQCAERAAVTAATAAGTRRIATCVIITDTPTPTMPCGACRQVLAECNPAMEIISRTLSGAQERTTLAQLLPQGFTPEHLLGIPR
jgi:cytidine deaminase